MRFSIGHTHVYPGCKVRLSDAPGRKRGADCLIEFSDGVVVPGRYAASTDAIILRVPAHRTAKGTRIVAKSWRLEPDGAGGVWRVRERLPDDPGEPATDAD